MDSTTPARMVVVKKEEKESKLRTLILSALAAPAPASGCLELRVLAVTSASPVVAAVTALKAELTLAGVKARIMLVKNAASATAILPGNCTVRHLGDARCHDAHEVLVLGTQTAWTGDSLRRDPVGRDSFEMHAICAPTTTHFIAQSFERLWKIALPVHEREDETVLGLAADLSALAAPADTSQALTRH